MAQSMPDLCYGFAFGTYTKNQMHSTYHGQFLPSQTARPLGIPTQTLGL